MYRFVKYSQVKPYANICRKGLAKMQKKVRSKHHLTMQIDLIGSGKNRVVTRNGNQPFDLDFNIYLKKIPANLVDNPKKIKGIIKGNLDEVLKNTGFSAGKNSTSAITYIMHKNSKVKKDFSFDVGILSYSNSAHNWQRLIYDKANNRYIWNELFDSCGIEKREKILYSTASLAEKVRTTYLEKKNENLQSSNRKSSYQLYIEAINEVYYSEVGE
ncbi:MAG: hypothetical protein ACIRZX_08590 [Lactobacillus crispatus]